MVLHGRRRADGTGQLDVALIHMHRGDRGGTGQFLGIDPYFDDLFCLAARKRFMSVEQIVDTEEFLRLGPPQLLPRPQDDGAVQRGIERLLMVLRRTNSAHLHRLWCATSIRYRVEGRRSCGFIGSLRACSARPLLTRQRFAQHRHLTSLDSKTAKR